MPAAVVACLLLSSVSLGLLIGYALGVVRGWRQAEGFYRLSGGGR